MWNLTVPWWELIIRGVIVYAFLLILIRMTGKRQVGQLAPFDLILLLVLSNAVQNAMNGGDNSVGGGLISAVTLVLLNYGVGFATYRSKTLEGIIEGRPEVLIHNGTLFPAVMKRAQLTHHELTAALRQAGSRSSRNRKLASNNCSTVTFPPPNLCRSAGVTRARCFVVVCASTVTSHSSPEIGSTRIMEG